MRAKHHWVKTMRVDLPEPTPVFPRAPATSVIEVIELTVTEGGGTEGDPYREVAYYYLLDGTCVARRDMWELSPQREKPETPESTQPSGEGGE